MGLRATERAHEKVVMLGPPPRWKNDKLALSPSRNPITEQQGKYVYMSTDKPNAFGT
jgi:hypothetical protein